MSILFINGSPNKNGNTAELAETLMLPVTIGMYAVTWKKLVNGDT